MPMPTAGYTRLPGNQYAVYRPAIWLRKRTLGERYPSSVAMLAFSLITAIHFITNTIKPKSERLGFNNLVEKLNEFDGNVDTFLATPELAEAQTGGTPPTKRQQYRDLWAGAFYPLINAGRDLLKIFKPYKSNRHWLKDLATPLYGILNIIGGWLLFWLSIASIFIYPASGMIVGFLEGLLLNEGWERLYCIPKAAKGFAMGVATVAFYVPSWFIGAVLKFVRGVAQLLLMTLFTYFYTIPSRVIASAICKFTPSLKRWYNDYSTIEGSRTIQQLMSEAGESPTNEKKCEILDAFHAKYLNGSGKWTPGLYTRLKLNDMIIPCSKFKETEPNTNYADKQGFANALWSELQKDRSMDQTEPKPLHHFASPAA